MRVRTPWRLVRDGSLGVLLGVGRRQVPFSRLTFLAVALRAGLLARLAAEPVPFERLVAELTVGPAGHDGLRAWLRREKRNAPAYTPCVDGDTRYGRKRQE